MRNADLRLTALRRHICPHATSSAAKDRHVLIVGATGIVGRPVVEIFDNTPGWKVTAISRRSLDYPTSPSVDHISLDLTDATRCDEVFSGLGSVTHLVYGAYQPGSTTPGNHAANGAMFENTLVPLHAACGGGLAQVQLLQGGKAYGV